MIRTLYFVIFLLSALKMEYFPISGALVGNDEMKPAMRFGDILVFQNFTDPSVGDIVKFSFPYYPNGKKLSLAHRVVSVPRQGCFVTKADNHSSLDNERFYKRCVPRSVINGVLMARVQRIGAPFVLIKSFLGDEIIIAACLCGSILYTHKAIFGVLH